MNDFTAACPKCGSNQCRVWSEQCVSGKDWKVLCPACGYQTGTFDMEHETSSDRFGVCPECGSVCQNSSGWASLEYGMPYWGVSCLRCSYAKNG